MINLILHSMALSHFVPLPLPVPHDLNLLLNFPFNKFDFDNNFAIYFVWIFPERFFVSLPSGFINFIHSSKSSRPVYKLQQL